MKMDTDVDITETDSSDHGLILCDYSIFIITLIVISVLFLLSICCNFYSFMKYRCCHRDIRVRSKLSVSNNDQSLIAPNIRCHIYSNNKETAL